MRRYKIVIEYDGTNFCGWQSQINKLSVQEALENIISDFLKEKIKLCGASRTDSGVHAKSQVAHFDLSSQNMKMQCGFISSINFFLQANDHKIRIVKIDQVSQDFHARFNAKIKTYSYRLINQTPITLNQEAWQIKPRLNLVNMILAAHEFIGKHDFSSFRAQQCQAKNAIRSIDQIIFQIKSQQHSSESCTIKLYDQMEYFKSQHINHSQNNSTSQNRSQDISQSFIKQANLSCVIIDNLSSQNILPTVDQFAFENLKQLSDKLMFVNQLNYATHIEIYFVGKSFLHHMIRNIVGTLVHVGLSKIAFEDIKSILFSKKRALSGPTAPAKGLLLLNIKY